MLLQHNGKSPGSLINEAKKVIEFQIMVPLPKTDSDALNNMSKLFLDTERQAKIEIP